MPTTSANKAEIEYAVMLAVLNFQTEFMKSHYTRAQVHVVEDLIEVVLTKTTSIPAEDHLARSAHGRTVLQQANHALFVSGEPWLRERLEQALGIKVHHVLSQMDSMGGTTTIVIKLAAPLRR